MYNIKYKFPKDSFLLKNKNSTFINFQSCSLTLLLHRAKKGKLPILLPFFDKAT